MGRTIRAVAVTLALLAGMSGWASATQPDTVARPTIDESARCPFRIVVEEGSLWHAWMTEEDRSDMDQVPQPQRHNDSTGSAWDFVQPLESGGMVLQVAIRGSCLWLLDDTGQPLPVGDADHVLGSIDSVGRTVSDDPPPGALFLLGFERSEADRGTSYLKAARLLRYSPEATRLSPLLNAYPKLVDSPYRLYDRPTGYAYETSHFDLRFGTPGRLWIVQQQGGGFGVLDIERMNYVVPPIYAEIRGYQVSSNRERVGYWGALTLPGGADGEQPTITLFDRTGKRLLDEFDITAIENTPHGNLQPVRIRDDGLPFPETPPINSSRLDTGNACVYLTPTGTLLEAPFAWPDHSQLCPAPNSDGLLTLRYGADKFSIYRITLNGSDASPERLKISDVHGRLITSDTHGLAIVAEGEVGALRYRIYDLTGKLLQPKHFDKFENLGCGHRRVHLAENDTWYSINLDGTLSTRLTYPFSC
ncbi:hypothetical protein [Pseudoxanthomonas putridarboris]|uniref:Uncharacterized protein n=1 Tax=Pseudoxanthomonas putridarboris TaxID=752605 RepID=A0ABU9J6C5_9GAMM